MQKFKIDFFLYNNTLFHNFTYKGKITKIVEN